MEHLSAMDATDYQTNDNLLIHQERVVRLFVDLGLLFADFDSG
jgi:hypothetical protein